MRQASSEHTVMRTTAVTIRNFDFQKRHNTVQRMGKTM